MNDNAMLRGDTLNREHAVNSQVTDLKSRKKFLSSYYGKHSFKSSQCSLSRLSSSNRKDRLTTGTGGIFSFFSRFRGRNRAFPGSDSSGGSAVQVASLPSSPRDVRKVNRGHWSSSESVLSTATTNSFSFIPVNELRDFPTNVYPKEAYFPTSDRETYTRRYNGNTDGEDRLEEGRKISLREKYNLLASDTIYRSAEEIRVRRRISESRKDFARRNPRPVSVTEASLNLGTCLQNSTDNSLTTSRHRRAVSEALDTSYRRLKGPYCHRPGKRRAPQPPRTALLKSIGGSCHNLNSLNNRKKRRAPPPPTNDNKMETPPPETNNDVKLSSEIVYNDSLKLEKGVLKSNKQTSLESAKSDASTNTATEIPVPVSPKPWYKRPSQNIDRSCRFGNHVEKKKTNQQLLDEWMLEAGLPRSSSFYDQHRNSVFSKAEDKRRSQVSMLANISELDREAAEIIQKEQKRKKDLANALNDRFYSKQYNLDDATDRREEILYSEIGAPKRNTARELISLFNSITNVTKVTVSTSFFSRDGYGGNFLGRKSSERKNSRGKFDKRSSSVDTARNVGRKFPQQPETSEVLVYEVQEPEDEKSEESETNNEDKDKTVGKKVQNKEEIEIIEIPEKVRVDRMSKSFSAESCDVSKSASSTSNASDSSASGSSKHTKPIFSNWVCPKCTLENPSWKFICEACNKWRPYSASTSISKSSSSSDVFETIARKNAQSKKETVRDSAKKETIGDASKKCINRDILSQALSFEKKKENEIGKVEDENIIYIDDTERPSTSKAFPISSAKSPAVNNVSKTGNNNLNLGPSSSTNIQLNNLDKTEDNKEINIKDKDDNLEEIRKARLSYFNGRDKSRNHNNDNANKAVDNVNISNGEKSMEKYYNDEDRQKLRDILKDLKNSLSSKTDQVPKNEPTKSEVYHQSEQSRSKLNSNVTSSRITKSHFKTDVSEDLAKIDATTEKSNLPHKTKQFANQKPTDKLEVAVTADSDRINGINVGRPLPEVPANESSVSGCKGSQKAEVYIIRTKTELQDIKMKPQEEDTQKMNNIENIEEKDIRSIIKEMVRHSPNVKVKSANSSGTLSSGLKPITIPVKNYGVKDGAPYLVRTGKEKVYVKQRPFQLIHARDFNNNFPGHTYENVPRNDENLTKVDGINVVVESETDPKDNAEDLKQQLSRLKLLASAKNSIKNGDKRNANTVAINRLLKKLQLAIASGQHHEAANLARDLARLKVNCNVTRMSPCSSTSDATHSDTIRVNMYVEDKVSRQGPIPLMVSPAMTVAQLKAKVEREFDIPARVQKWILARHLANENTQTLKNAGIDVDGLPVFLYLVAPEILPPKLETSSIISEKREDGEKSDSVISGLTKSCSTETESLLTNSVKGTDDEKTDTTNELSDHRLSELEDDVFSDDDNVKVDAVEDDRKYDSIHRNNVGTLTIGERQKDFGWECVLCTLINTPTSLECAACTNERPENYVVPKSEEELRKEREKAEQERKQKEEEEAAAQKLANYQQLVDLEREDLVPNTDQFECSVCFLKYDPGQGVILRDCLHAFCKECLAQTIQFNTEAEVKCPYRDNNYACESLFQEREIKALVSTEVYEQHLARSIAEAETKTQNAFHCKTPNCKGWCIYEDNVNHFYCPVCHHTNCLTCQAIHTGLNCKQYQELVNEKSETSVDARRTKDMLQGMVEKGDAITCPTCQVILMKKWGCDWVRCSMCKTEICWVTRGPRWGPAGKGDTSGGCQCGVNGIKCHPRCNYCH